MLGLIPKSRNAILLCWVYGLRTGTLAIGTDSYLASKNSSFGVTLGWNPSLATYSWVTVNELCSLSRPQFPHVLDNGVNDNDIAVTPYCMGLWGASETILVECSAECLSSRKQPWRMLAALVLLFDTVLQWAGSPRSLRAFGLGIHWQNQIGTSRPFRCSRFHFPCSSFSECEVKFCLKKTVKQLDFVTSQVKSAAGNVG